MIAKVRGLWLLVECPHCNCPNVITKHLMDNAISGILKTRYEECEECGKGFFWELTEISHELQI
jgi:hypothetical protein